VSTERTAAYRRWTQRIRSRAARRLIAMHQADWRRLLAEEQAAEPWEGA
jgi:23S rRNA U2552 (ribose-2'-O)-methylase RlmE/FtsJ